MAFSYTMKEKQGSFEGIRLEERYRDYKEIWRVEEVRRIHKSQRLILSVINKIGLC